MSEGQIYCIDSSSLIAAHNRIYPRNVFVGLWEKVGELVQQARLVAPEEVLKGIEYQEDDLTTWAKEHRQMFAKPDYYLIAFLTEIARDLPQLSQNKVAANTADPFVIALAKVKGYVVVSEEKRESLKNPKIPQLCRHYQVSPVSFLHLITGEGWVFP